uniref:Deacetylase sirtuin-type domain-containing protein n=1 Tax=Chromera velia CCMP2878 TaxID=1169474 RepID=A0A0G4FZR5_9ALVE|eukprot:Cvel_3983.t1-p1 / transcript=Cvel_3983.t1 / gene=Cvel_3983 / organism=Chromera_velia_CCMP2878 / gene_product=NAD-dependent protein deacetylase sirtuin-2, putative / transcript_product=NAD-dependent protein deacetylase sirtuin-2, putative / location=Cvel_scaffold169:25927-32135(-) / protein_length=510 / sequence_SO=supercontig / SO=protein_coding / is_pseudo=false
MSDSSSSSEESSRDSSVDTKEVDRKAVLEKYAGEVSVDALVEKIRRGDARKIMLMTGAGISCASGIPDFRTPGTGLYSQLERYALPYPEAIFDIDFFKDNPKPFCTLAKELFPGQFRPTKAHFFSSLLAKKGLLVRHYTQNIDNLERLAGVPGDLLVEAHGSFHDVHCTRCRSQFPIEWYREMVVSGEIPTCDRRVARRIDPSSEEALGAARRILRSGAGEGEAAEAPLEKIVACGGLIKPDIVFFGEGLPERFWRLQKEDFQSADVLIVMGTSLQVHPFAGLVRKARPECARLLINLEAAGRCKEYSDEMRWDGMFGDMGGDGRAEAEGGKRLPRDDGWFRFHLDDNYRDLFIQDTTESGIEILCHKLGWTEELEALIADYEGRHEDSWRLLTEEQDKRISQDVKSHYMNKLKDFRKEKEEKEKEQGGKGTPPAAAAAGPGVSPITPLAAAGKDQKKTEETPTTPLNLSGRETEAGGDLLGASTKAVKGTPSPPVPPDSASTGPTVIEY